MPLIKSNNHFFSRKLRDYRRMMAVMQPMDSWVNLVDRWWIRRRHTPNRDLKNQNFIVFIIDSPENLLIWLVLKSTTLKSENKNFKYTQTFIYRHSFDRRHHHHPRRVLSHHHHLDARRDDDDDDDLLFFVQPAIAFAMDPHRVSSDCLNASFGGRTCL